MAERPEKAEKMDKAERSPKYRQEIQQVSLPFD